MDKARRLQEIECELLKIELDVWMELNREQEVLVDAERREMDALAEAVYQAQCAYDEEVERLLKEIESASEQQRHLRARKEVAEEDRWTQTDRSPVNAALRDDDLKILRAEIESLECVARLQDEQLRLTKEPAEGENFVRLREARRLEEEAIAELDKKVAELEMEVQMAEAGNLPPAEDPSVLEDFSWADAPWDLVGDGVDEVQLPPPPPEIAQPPGPFQGAQAWIFQEASSEQRHAAPGISAVPSGGRCAAVSGTLASSAACPPGSRRPSGPPARFVPKKAILFKK